jgi:hypothetical protein
MHKEYYTTVEVPEHAIAPATALCNLHFYGCSHAVCIEKSIECVAD